MTKNALVFAMILLLFALAPCTLALVVCYDDGSIVLFTNVIGDVTTRTEESKTFFNVTGKWSGGSDAGFTFKSDAATFNMPFSNYIDVTFPQIELVSSGEGSHWEVVSVKETVKCPGFNFSCRFVNISVERCYEEGSTKVVLFKTANLDDIRNLEYKAFTKEGRVFTFGKDIRSPMLRNIVYVQNDTSSLSFETDYGMDRIEIRDNRCAGKYYFVKHHTCDDTKPEPVVEIVNATVNETKEPTAPAPTVVEKQTFFGKLKKFFGKLIFWKKK